VDGPQSLLASSTRYGLQLATFFPAILLVEAEWRLEAEIRWGKRGLRKDLVLDSSLELRTHYRDTGAWQSRTEQFLLERWETADTDGWELMPGELLDLGGQRIVVPDLKLEKEGRVAWLDIVGYWRARWLKDHLDGTPDHVIVAASRRLVGDRKGGVPKRLEHRCVPFAEVIPVKDLLACAERVAVRP
jgi:predicted nuclease of restriction endonuclease-like RecB superfamily